MANEKLPDVGILVNIVDLEWKGDSLVMKYSFRPYLLWIFLIVSVLISSLFFALQPSASISMLFLCLLITYLLQSKLFDRGQIEFNQREIICKRGNLMSKSIFLRRYYNSYLRTESRVEYGSTQHGKVENYYADISDSYNTFTVSCPTREQSTKFVKIMKECELQTMDEQVPANK